MIHISRFNRYFYHLQEQMYTLIQIYITLISIMLNLTTQFIFTTCVISLLYISVFYQVRYVIYVLFRFVSEFTHVHIIHYMGSMEWYVLFYFISNVV